MNIQRRKAKLALSLALPLVIRAITLVFNRPGVIFGSDTFESELRP